MVLLLVLGVAGLASWSLWPEPWRLGLALGWAGALALEMVLLRQRRRALRPGSRANAMLSVLVLSFLSKLLLIGLGGITGTYSGLFHGPAFVLAFLAGALLGEVVVVTGTLRAERARDSAAASSEAGAPPREPA